MGKTFTGRHIWSEPKLLAYFRQQPIENANKLTNLLIHKTAPKIPKFFLRHRTFCNGRFTRTYWLVSKNQPRSFSFFTFLPPARRFKNKKFRRLVLPDPKNNSMKKFLLPQFLCLRTTTSSFLIQKPHTNPTLALNRNYFTSNTKMCLTTTSNTNTPTTSTNDKSVVATSPTDDDENVVTPIFNLMMSQYHSSTLVIFGRLGLFDFIHDNQKDGGDGATVQDVATHANWSVRATSAMLISLTANGILETSAPADDSHSFEHKYKLTPRSAKFLLKDVPGSVVAYLELFWEFSPQQLLDKASADKKQDNFMLETGGGAPSDMFINAMQGQTSHAAMVLSPLLATAMGDNGTTDGRFVDVGGGSGTFCLEFCKAMPHWKGSIYELAGVCPISEKFITKAAMTDRVTAIPGDMFKDQSFPPATCYGFGNVLHDWSDEDNTALLQKAYDSLPSNGDGGKVVLLEMLVSEDVTSTTNAAAGLNLIMVTNEDGRQYKASELQSMLEKVGFVDVQVISSPVTPYSAVVASKK